MSRCACGSYAINIGAHGRVSGKNKDLCDVCYWRADYARLEQECERLSNELNNMRISWGLMQAEREAALKQVEGLRQALIKIHGRFEVFVGDDSGMQVHSVEVLMDIAARGLSTKP